jgi:methionyl-tRNA formyltransferase
MLNYRILFFGKFNDKYSRKFLKILKKNFKYVKVIWNLKRNKKIKINLKIDYIFCFRSHFILNKKIISKAKIHAINFHPGPPAYRGIGCVNFSLLNNDKKYGATVHLINEKIDNGKILLVSKFKILKNDDILSLLRRTYNVQLKQLRFVIKSIKLYGGQLDFLVKKNKVKWSKKLYTRNELNKLYHINNKISKKKVETLLRATVTEHFKPFVKIGNAKFFYENK